MIRKMLLALLALATFGLALAAVAPRVARGAEGQTKEVVIRDMAFLVDGKEQPLTVEVGDCVVFVNEDMVAHTATSDDGGRIFDTGPIPHGGRSKAITVAPSWKGTRVRFFCAPHRSMTGSLDVK